MMPTDTFPWRKAHAVEVEVRVAVDVRDPDVIARITGPGGDEWRSQFYGSIRTEDDVFEHFAWNAVHNGVERANRLEGWADLADDAATMRVLRG